MMICGGCGVINGCACFFTHGQPTVQSTPKKKPSSQYTPPSSSSSTPSDMSVDDAWIMFGITKKRGTKEDVKKIYLAFITAHHPDKHPNNQKWATEQFVRAGNAWALLQKHCNW
jgi:DnaJ domain